MSESAPGGLTASDVSGNGSSAVTLSGSISQVNATLASSPALIYTPHADFFGTDSLTTTVNDNGHSGTGGALSDSKGFEIHVLAADVRLVKSVTTPTVLRAMPSPIP